VELSRVRPTTLDLLKQVRGIGEKKLADFGQVLVKLIAEYCREQQVSTDIPPANLASYDAPAAPAPVTKGMNSEAKRLAFRMFDEGRTLDEVRQKIERAHSTTIEYLADYIATHRPASIEPWIAPTLYQRIAEAIAGVQKHAPSDEAWRLSPIFAALDGAVPYDDIRLVVAHMRAVQPG
jgi:ATP-dependent DNA helicase RecQ